MCSSRQAKIKSEILSVYLCLFLFTSLFNLTTVQVSWIWSYRFSCFYSTLKHRVLKAEAGEGLVSFSKTLWQTTQDCQQRCYILWEIKPSIFYCYESTSKTSLIRFQAGSLQKLRGWMGMKHPLSSIPFVIWRSPHDHQTSVVFCLCTRGKSFHRQKKKRGLLHCTDPLGVRERTLHSSCVYLNLTSDQITGR